MTTSDPIADMLTRIRNANTAKHDTVDVPAKALKYLAVYKAFALTGRLADCHYTQGAALG